MVYTHIYTHKFAKQEGSPERCRSAVHDEGRWPSYHQCTRKPKVFRCIDGIEYGFCGIHDPDAVAKKDNAKREQWRLESLERERKENLRKQNVVAMEACKAAIQKIADGHNDPMTLAKETLLLFPK